MPAGNATGAPTLLVIGYGNTLRSDDGAGVRVAEAMAAMQLPGVEAVAVHQLLPEHAEWLARVDRAVFVDARVTDEGAEPTIEPIGEPAAPHVPGHVADPGALLAMARLLYGRAPRAWLLAVPGVAFAIGEGLSATAARGVTRAIDQIAGLIANDA